MTLDDPTCRNFAIRCLLLMLTLLAASRATPGAVCETTTLATAASLTTNPSVSSNADLVAFTSDEDLTGNNADASPEVFLYPDVA